MAKLAEHDNNFNLIRLVAAFQVMAVHALNHFEVKGFLVDVLKATPGVPTFFFISGYLICTSYKRMHLRGNGAFFANRFLRIYPGLIACVLLSTLAVALTGYFQHKDIGVSRFLLWILGQTTIFQFYNPDFMRPFGVGVLNGALWTITVELQFYLLVPLLYYLIQRRPRALVAVVLMSLGLNLFLHGFADGKALHIKLLYVSFAPWVYMFLFGFILAYREVLFDVVRRFEFKYLIVGYIAAMNVIGDYTSNAQNAINPVAFFFLGCLILKLATMRLALPPKLARFVDKSDFSYGLYLYHMPVINMLLFLGLFTASVNIALAVALSLAAAVFSWYAVEKPALKHKR
jgi:peptidoglycan/LPS O-acetylase OafA/YrhL